MTELITVHYENERPTVSGRDLREKLGIATQYTKWFERMAEYGFVENEDYAAISQKRLTAQGNETTFIDHQLTIDMAKQICMIQRTQGDGTGSISSTWNEDGTRRKQSWHVRCKWQTGSCQP